MWRLGLVTVAVVLAACGRDGETADPATFCERLDRLTENDPFRAFGDTANPGEIEEGFRALVERADELVEVAPDEGRGAAQDFADSASTMQSAMADAGFAPDGLDTRTYRDAQLAYTEASGRLLRYLDTEC